MGRRWVILIGCAGVLVPAAPALAAIPSNDDIANAMAVTRLPFDSTVDTTDATTEPGEPSCDQLTHTVWYRYTASSSGRVGVILSRGETTVFTGAPGDLTQIAGCNIEENWRAAAGTTYYIQVGTSPFGDPGPVDVHVQRVLAVHATVAIDPTAVLDTRTHTATFTGTLSCNQPIVADPLGYAEVDVSGDVTQGSGRFFAEGGFFRPRAACSTTPRPWRATATSSTFVPFKGGWVSVGLSPGVCNRFDLCDFRTDAVRVRLGPGSASSVDTAAATGAAAPPNDDITGASAVGGLPYTDRLDLATATSAPGDLNCAGGDSNTVWYRFAPRRDVHLGVAALGPRIGFGFDTVTVAGGAPGNLTMLACGQDTVSLHASAGTTYWIQVAACCGVPAGPTMVRFERVGRFTFTDTIDPAGTVDSGGTATVSGTISCSRSVLLGGDTALVGDITQAVGQHEATSDYSTSNDGFLCSTTPRPWSSSAVSFSGVRFGSGPATVTIGPDQGELSLWGIAAREIDAPPTTVKLRRV
jgi:hypothetical protein